MGRDAAETVAAYYDALEGGETLSSFFAEAPNTVKIGLSERLVGYADVASGLSEQTATTDDWSVESNDLSVTVDDDIAWFDDQVTLAWQDIPTDTDYSFESRWTGTLRRRDDDWQFVTLHVSAPNEALQTAEDDLFSWEG